MDTYELLNNSQESVLIIPIDVSFIGIGMIEQNVVAFPENNQNRGFRANYVCAIKHGERINNPLNFFFEKSAVSNPLIWSPSYQLFFCCI